MAILYVFENLLNDCLNKTARLPNLLPCSNCWEMLFGLKYMKKHPAAHRYIVGKEKNVLIIFSFNCGFLPLILLSASYRFLKIGCYMETKIKG